MDPSDKKIQLVHDLIQNGLDAHEKIMLGEAYKPTHSVTFIGTRTVLVPAKSVTISRCYHECPFFMLDGGPSPMMLCGHPSLAGKGIEAAAIISHPSCDDGFPERCPLWTTH